MRMILTLRLTSKLMILTGKTTSQTLILKIKETGMKWSQCLYNNGKSSVLVYSCYTLSQIIIIIIIVLSCMSTDNILAFKKPFFFPFLLCLFFPLLLLSHLLLHVVIVMNVLLFYCYTVQCKYFVGYKFCRFVTILISQITGIIYSHMTSHLFIFTVIIISCFEGKQ